jgi:hypothetical protein
VFEDTWGGFGGGGVVSMIDEASARGRIACDLEYFEYTLLLGLLLAILESVEEAGIDSHLDVKSEAER